MSFLHWALEAHIALSLTLLSHQLFRQGYQPRLELNVQKPFVM